MCRIDEEQYKTIQSTNCTWLCPKCDTTNTSSFRNSETSIANDNRFEFLSDSYVEKKTIPKTTRANSIDIVSININSIRGKRLDLQAYLATENPDVVAIQETKIDSSIPSNELIPDTLDYDIYRNDRTLSGGGTMLLIKKKFESQPLKNLENSSE